MGPQGQTSRPVSSKLAQFAQSHNKDSKSIALKRMRSNKEMLAYLKQNFASDAKSRSMENLNKNPASVMKKKISLIPKFPK